MSTAISIKGLFHFIPLTQTPLNPFTTGGTCVFLKEIMQLKMYNRQILAVGTVGTHLYRLLVKIFIKGVIFQQQLLKQLTHRTVRLLETYQYTYRIYS